MAYQTITVVPDDGDTVELKIEPRDALIWEKTGKNNPSILEYLSRPSMIEAYRLAHIAMKRQHQYGGSLKDFEDSHDVRIAYDVFSGTAEVDAEPDPTDPEVSTDDSSS